MLLIDLLNVSCSDYFHIETRTTSPGMVPVTGAGNNHFNQKLRKFPIGFPPVRLIETFSQPKLPLMPVTLVYVNLT